MKAIVVPLCVSRARSINFELDHPSLDMSYVCKCYKRAAGRPNLFRSRASVGPERERDEGRKAIKNSVDKKPITLDKWNAHRRESEGGENDRNSIVPQTAFPSFTMMVVTWARGGCAPNVLSSVFRCAYYYSRSTGRNVSINTFRTAFKLLAGDGVVQKNKNFNPYGLGKRLHVKLAALILRNVRETVINNIRIIAIFRINVNVWNKVNNTFFSLINLPTFEYRKE